MTAQTLTPSTTQTGEAKGVPAAAWAILALLTVGIIIAFVDRTSVSAAVADKGFVAHFALNDMDRGWVNSAFFWSYGLLQLPMGYIVDRYGVKAPYAICFLLWCLATAVTGLMTAFVGLIIMRLIVGATEAVVMPASYRWIRHNIPESHTGTAVGIFTMGNKLGTAVGAPIAAWLIVALDWRLMFVVTGTLGLIWLLPWMLLVKSDLPKGADLAEVKRKAATVPFRNIIASPVVWGAMIVNFCYGYFTFYCMTWMPAYLVERRGLSLEQSGLYTFFSFAGIAMVAVAAGWAADRLIAGGRDPVVVRKAFVITGFIGACTVLLGAYAEDLSTALFWNVFSLSWLGLATANNLALCKVTLIPKPAVGTVVGVQQVATSLAGGISASLSGWLLHTSGGYDLPMMVIFVFLIIGAAANLILLRPQWAPKINEEAAA